MHKLNIDQSSELRALLTDTLPYETPFFFSNERLYSAACLATPFSNIPSFAEKMLSGARTCRPFLYSVHKGGGSARRLAVPHPASQISIAKFYGQFDGFILDLCSRSSYSLRYPSRIGSHYFESKFSSSDEDPDSPEVDLDPSSFHRQRKWASAYFNYRRYTQMYKFFSSAEFSRLEQRYEFMLQVDISKCFDSIYTHSLCWAVRGKEFSKNNIHSNSFESKFDATMRNANWAETNGILVGPEVSRIFAEIIMQEVDRRIEAQVVQSDLSITVRRYIDDYLIFGESEHDVRDCKKFIENSIQEFNLHLNQSKELLSRRPLISPLTVARESVHGAISEFFTRARKSLTHSPSADEFFSESAADLLIAKIRKIAGSNKVSYAVLASSALAVMVRSIHRLRVRCAAYSETDPPSKFGQTVISECLKVSLFLLCMDIRVATTHKAAKIFYESSFLAKKLRVNNRAFEGQIVDSMRQILNRAGELGIKGPEVVNLLVAVEAVCSRHRAVGVSDVARSLGADSGWDSTVSQMNYFDLVSILYFSRRKVEFADAKLAAIAEIQSRIRAAGKEIGSRAEETLLFFDFISCPHIDKPLKEAMVRTVAGEVLGTQITETTAAEYTSQLSNEMGFVIWDGAKHFRALLERKELQPAYD